MNKCPAQGVKHRNAEQRRNAFFRQFLQFLLNFCKFTLLRKFECSSKKISISTSNLQRNLTFDQSYCQVNNVFSSLAIMDRGFSEYQFKRRVDLALNHVRTILDNTRNPQYPADVSHDYEDKYVLSNFLANSTIAALFTSLELIGVNEKNFVQLKEWAQKKSVTLRLNATEACKFLSKATREVESDTKNVC